LKFSKIAAGNYQYQRHPTPVLAKPAAKGVLSRGMSIMETRDHGNNRNHEAFFKTARWHINSFGFLTGKIKRNSQVGKFIVAGSNIFYWLSYKG
jgi:hypothetical protein